MTSPNLEGLAQSGELKPQRFSQREIDFLLLRAMDMLADARLPELTPESRFSLGYGAAHALARAALGLHGFRSQNRYLVFQCLEHTAGLSQAQCRLFTLCHERRNKAEYEGRFDVEEALQSALLRATAELFEKVSGMPSPTR
jgi:hypothetical protein